MGIDKMNKYVAICLLVMQSFMIVAMQEKRHMSSERMAILRDIHWKKRISNSGEMSTESSSTQSSGEMSLEQQEIVITECTRCQSRPIPIPTKKTNYKNDHIF